LETDHSSMESNGKAIADEGGEFAKSVNLLRAQLVPLIPYFGNPSTDEAARIFRRGAEGHPGFDSAYDNLSKAMHNLSEAYEHIGSAVVMMSKNVKAADWASMVDKDKYVKELVEFAERKHDAISVPTTPVERD
jgi:hypothetical protein